MFCRVCDSKYLDLAVDLGNQPWGNHFLKMEDVGKEAHYPLQVVYCQECSTAQLNYTVKKEVMFSDHTYLSGMTKSLSQHFESVAKKVDQHFFSNQPDKSVLDIGSNDGTQLKHFQALDYNVLGVESSKTTAKIANDNDVPTLHTFFNEETVDEMNRQFDVINASGVFFHLEELHSVCEGIRKALKKGGVFVVQFMYMKRILENVAFDQIYHEHLLYYNLKTIEVLLNRHGLSLFDAYLSPIHGGSIIAYVGHQGVYKSTKELLKLWEAEYQSACNQFQAYQDFAKKIEIFKKKTLSFLQEQKSKGKTIYGFGAPVKGNTFLNSFKIGTQYLDCLVEKNPLRKDLFSPGMNIPVVLEDGLEKLPDIYLVLAWNFKDEILEKNQALIDQGIQFYFPGDMLSDTR